MKFRRGQRVAVKNHSGDITLGNVTNPNGDKLWGGVNVRLDSQQSYEMGQNFAVDNVEPYSGSETQFEKRRYDLRHLSHQEIGALKLALERVNYRDDVLTDEIVQKLLKQLPSLP